jgi:hypothetical protein
MARTAPNGTIRHRVRTRYLDEHGREFYVTEYREEVTQDPTDQAVVKETQAENVILASGEAYNPGMSAGAKPLILVGACRFCSGSLCNVSSLLPCEACGRVTCREHRRQSTYDERWRCLRCDQRHRVRQFLLGLVSRSPEE